jgi:hypothetical protein
MEYKAELKRAEQHVREEEHLVARQRKLVRELAEHHHPTASSAVLPSRRKSSSTVIRFSHNR